MFPAPAVRRADWRLVGGLLLALCWPMAPALAELAEPPAGVAACEQCHGAGGVSSQSRVPHLAGQLASYLVDSMQAIKSGKRPSTVADHIPARLEPPAIDAIAAYFSASRAPRPKIPFDPAQVAIGLGGYLDRCAACHTDSGRETDDRGLGAPRLAGQQLEYLLTQEHDFESGRRKFSSYMMERAFFGLSDPVREAVAHFFAAQDTIPLPPKPPPTPRRKRQGQ